MGISDFGFRVSDVGLGISDFGFRISDLILGGLPSAVCRLSYILLPFLFSLFLPLPATAQTSDVVDLLLQQRAEVRVAELLEAMDDRIVPRSYIQMYELTSYWLWIQQNLARRKAIADSLAIEMEPATAPSDSFGSTPVRWRKFAADEQGEFLDRYREVFWRAIGTPDPRDTLATPHLRAQLNGLFGAPTRNAAAMEQEEYAGSEFVQFEYWLVANDSIPVLVLDIDGPFRRGLLVATDEAYTDVYAALKKDLFRQMLDSEPTPYADYYHSRERGQWYRTGFDGTEYFVRETRRPRWATRRSREEKWRIFR